MFEFFGRGGSILHLFLPHFHVAQPQRSTTGHREASPGEVRGDNIFQGHLDRSYYRRRDIVNWFIHHILPGFKLEQATLE